MNCLFAIRAGMVKSDSIPHILLQVRQEPTARLYCTGKRGWMHYGSDYAYELQRVGMQV